MRQKRGVISARELGDFSVLPARISIEAASNYCNHRIEANFEDWRGPTHDELVGVSGETRAGARLFANESQTNAFFLAPDSYRATNLQTSELPTRWE